MNLIDNLDAEMALKLTEYSILAYCRDKQLVLDAEPNCHFFEQEETQGFVILGEEYDILAFRGTEPDRPKDLISDLKFLNTDFEFADGDKSYDVHTGFKQALDLVCDQIDDIRKDNIDRPVYVTGHSLGAALATLWTASQFNNPHRIAGLYTIGSPKVGSPAFAEKFDSKFKPVTWRFRNRQDLVTKQPNFGCQHVGQLVYFDRKGLPNMNTTKAFRNWWDEMLSIFEIEKKTDKGEDESNNILLKDHDMEKYRKLVAALPKHLS